MVPLLNTKPPALIVVAPAFENTMPEAILRSPLPTFTIVPLLTKAFVPPAFVIGNVPAMVSVCFAASVSEPP